MNIIPAWQKCPVCDGTGYGYMTIGLSTAPQLCHVCNGHGIINIYNGKPPEGSIYTGPDTEITFSFLQ